MILKASQRAGGSQLALHLLNDKDNDHVTVHQLRGFVADELLGAFKEAQAISRGTRCRQFLFSLSLNPPETAQVPVAVFEETLARIEKQLGLSAQPRAIVFHEKEGRRHAHCVWSRIDAQTMKSINLPHFKMKLQTISRELYIEHGWDMPAGLQDKKKHDLLNYQQSESQQARRAKQDPHELKRVFQTCWSNSDSLPAFTHALKEQGFILARGNRRGHVVVDRLGEVYALSRWLGIKAKAVRARLGLPDHLPSVDEAKSLLQSQLTDSLHEQCEELASAQQKQKAAFEKKRAALVKQQRDVRKELHTQLQQKCRVAIKQWQADQPRARGLSALWQRITGQTQQHEQARMTFIADYDQQQDEVQQALIEQQLRERRALRAAHEPERFSHTLTVKTLNREIGRSLQIDPAQPLILPVDEAAATRRASVERTPATILDFIIEHEEFFTQQTIRRELARYIDEPSVQQEALEQVLQSNELIEIANDSQTATPRYTTRTLQACQIALQQQVQTMNKHHHHGVAAGHKQQAIATQNAHLQQQVGASLSEEQCQAINHVLNPEQLSVVVGLAGAGKSTLLAAAHQAWKAQGCRVLGAALSGKAADGLQSASGIESRTLASWTLGWKNGRQPLQAGDVLVLDEAGMIGTQQMLEVIQHVTAQGAKLVLVGDPEQLQPISAGTPLRDITQQTTTVELSEIRRQRCQWQCKASVQLARGHTNVALAAYAERGAVQRSDDLTEAIENLANDYLDDENSQNRNGKQGRQLALAHRRIDVHKINQAIRAGKKQRGELSNEIWVDTTHGPRAFAVGERIVLTKNDHDLNLRNGQLGTVEKLDKDTLTLRLDSDGDTPERRVTISPTDYPDFDHGYATTIHKSQGATVDHTYLLASNTLDKHLLYVGMTRHKHSAKLYCSTDEIHRSPLFDLTESKQQRNKQRTGPTFH